MAGLLILPVDLLAGVIVWALFCGVANWIGTGRFRGERRG
jgi:hypothetical protein